MMASLTRLAPILPALDRLIEAASPQSKDAATRPLENRLRRGLVTMWAEQRRQVLERLPEFRHRFTEALSDDELNRLWLAVTLATEGSMQNLLDELAPVAMRRGHRAAARDVRMGLRFDLEHPRVVEFLRNYGANRVTAIDQVTRDKLRRLLTQAGQEGWSYARTARDIRTTFAGFGGVSPLRHIRDRATLVAVTEIGAAYEHGQQMVIRALADQDIATEKQWLDAGDERVCPICLPAAGQGWIASSETFTNGLSGPLGHPGCRCALQTRVAAQSRVAA